MDRIQKYLISKRRPDLAQECYENYIRLAADDEHKQN